MPEYRAPARPIGSREIRIGERKAYELRDGAIGRRRAGARIAGGREGLFEGGKRAGIHRIDQLIEVDDGIVDRADRAADFRREIARPQSSPDLKVFSRAASVRAFTA